MVGVGDKVVVGVFVKVGIGVTVGATTSTTAPITGNPLIPTACPLVDVAPTALTWYVPTAVTENPVTTV